MTSLTPLGASAAPRVIELNVYRVTIPVEDEGYGLSGGRRYTEFGSTVVRITAEDGTIGYGEASGGSR